MALANGGLHVGTDGNRLTIGRPLPSVSGEATYLFYKYGLYPADPLCRRDDLYRVTAGANIGLCRQPLFTRAFIVPVWRRSWWQGASVVRWYSFLEKNRERHRHVPSRRPRCSAILLSVFMIHRFRPVWEHSQYAIFAPFRWLCGG